MSRYNSNEKKKNDQAIKPRILLLRWPEQWQFNNQIVRYKDKV